MPGSTSFQESATFMYQGNLRSSGCFRSSSCSIAFQGVDRCQDWPPSTSVSVGKGDCMMSAPQDHNQETMVKVPPARRSAWTTRQKVIRLLWGTIGRLAWCIPTFRSPVLRMFGASVGRGCHFARRIELTIPWNITIGDRVIIEERAILYSLGRITIGSDSVIEVRAHLCAGSHDLRDSRFPLTRPPITLGAHCRIGIDTFVAPGIELGEGCIVMHRASVYSSHPAGTTLVGNPARPIEGEA